MPAAWARASARRRRRRGAGLAAVAQVARARTGQRGVVLAEDPARVRRGGGAGQRRVGLVQVPPPVGGLLEVVCGLGPRATGRAAPSRARTGPPAAGRLADPRRHHARARSASTSAPRGRPRRGRPGAADAVVNDRLGVRGAHRVPQELGGRVRPQPARRRGPPRAAGAARPRRARRPRRRARGGRGRPSGTGRAGRSSRMPGGRERGQRPLDVRGVHPADPCQGLGAGGGPAPRRSTGRSRAPAGRPAPAARAPSAAARRGWAAGRRLPPSGGPRARGDDPSRGALRQLAHGLRRLEIDPRRGRHGQAGGSSGESRPS